MESVRDMNTPTMKEYSPLKKLGTPNQDHLNDQFGALPDTAQTRSTTLTPEPLPQTYMAHTRNGISKGIEVGEREGLVKKKEKKKRKTYLK